MTRRVRAGLVSVLLAGAWLLVAPHPGHAQGLGLGGSSGKPIQVYAQQGIEWNQTDKRYIARGKARAVQGTTTVYGDTLIAYYEEVKGGGSEIYRMDAIGNVRIVSPNETAYGDKGVYDVRQGVMVLTGKKLRLITPSEVITARDSLEYYEGKGLAVARGDARSRARTKDKSKARTVRADVLSARFAKAKTAKNAAAGGATGGLKKVDAFGNVVVTRPGEIALGDRGVYLPDDDIANLWGNVRITRGESQMNGVRAEVNFRTGISRIIAGKTKGDSGPVRALIVPERKAPPKPGEAGRSQQGPSQNVNQ